MSYPNPNAFPPFQPYPPNQSYAPQAYPQPAQGIPIPQPRRPSESPYFAGTDTSPRARRHSSNASYVHPAHAPSYPPHTIQQPPTAWPATPPVGPGAQATYQALPRRRTSSTASTTLPHAAVPQAYPPPLSAQIPPREAPLVERPEYERRMSHQSERSVRSRRSTKSSKSARSTRSADVEKRPSLGDSLGVVWGSLVGAFDKRR